MVVGGKAGYIDRSGAMVIPPRFEGYFDFEDGLALAVIGADKRVFIDTTGRIVLRPRFDIVRDFSEGVAAVNNGQKRNPVNGLIEDPGKWGYIDKTGTLVIPLQFTHAESFSEGLAGVNAGAQGGFIDHSGKMVLGVPLEVSYDGFQGGIVLVQSGGEESYYNRVGHRLPTPKLTRGTGEPFSEGLAAVRLDGKWGYMDTAGTVVIPPSFLEAASFSEGLAAVQVPIDLVWCPSESGESRWGATKRYGYIDKTGTMVVPPLSDYPDSFSEGMAVISVCSKRSFIDRSGTIVLQPPFRVFSGLRNGLASVESDDGKGYIDRTGKIIWKPSK